MPDNFTDRQVIETEIRQLLESETDAIRLSDALFTPDGLFSQLASNSDERRDVAKSPLFKEAQASLAELRTRESAAFTKSVSGFSHPDNAERLHRLERV